MKVEEEFPDLFLCRHRADDQDLLLQPFQRFENLHSDFDGRLRVFFGQRLYTLARVAGDQCPVSDGLDGKSMVDDGQ